jgi:hypothetical protein
MKLYVLDYYLFSQSGDQGSQAAILSVSSHLLAADWHWWPDHNQPCCTHSVHRYSVAACAVPFTVSGHSQTVWYFVKLFLF